MKAVVFSFNPPTADGSLANARNAEWLAKELGVPLVCDERIAECKDLDVLFLVAGVFLYCRCLPALLEPIVTAKRVVWVQNDYTIKPPLAQGTAESPFRKAFRIRHMNQSAPVDYWSTIKSNAEKTPGSAYVNWNALDYTPMTDEEFEASWKPGVRKSAVIYYGADREHRRKAFQRYFTKQAAPLVISSFSRSLLERFHKDADVLPAWLRRDFRAQLSSYELGLYLEDDRSHDTFMSPATRFYEMLGCGTAMVFMPEAAEQLTLAGYNVGPYVARPESLSHRLETARDIAYAQRASWGTVNYPAVVRETVKNEFERMKQLVEVS